MDAHVRLLAGSTGAGARPSCGPSGQVWPRGCGHVLLHGASLSPPRASEGPVGGGVWPQLEEQKAEPQIQLNLDLSPQLL